MAWHVHVPRETRSRVKEPAVWLIMFNNWWARRFFFYVAALVVISVPVALPQIMGLSQGFRATDVGSMRYVRELIFVVAFADFVITLIAVKSCNLPKDIALVLLAALAYIFVLLWKDVSAGNDPLMAIFAFRMFLIAMFLVYATVAFAGARFALPQMIGFVIQLYIICACLAAVWELRTFPPLFYGATFLGPRVPVLAPSPILFSQVASTMLLYLFVIRARWFPIWAMMVFFLCLATGGRSGIIGTFLVFGLYLTFDTPGGLGLRVLKMVGMLGLAFGLYLAASSQSISGRANVNSLTEEARIDNWIELIQSMGSEAPMTVLFGTQLGMGTNAAFSSARTGLQSSNMPALEFSDSFFIATYLNFGLVGVALILAGVTIFVMRGFNSDFRERAGIGGMFVWLGLAQNIIEIHPANVVLMTCFGLAIAQRYRQTAPAPQRYHARSYQPDYEPDMPAQHPEPPLLGPQRDHPVQGGI
ncbi:hypothetical protein [Marinivivus vitaminiproducens]|uniref:hypothetical protein n=1 Tax=Marinivivus vitaminiproducens TaxID=3035935 RepID=UPI0027A4876A|nr:hypothetical protein P4R82_17570 [Geminicoccaceae bacterium SCSIO 64248]